MARIIGGKFDSEGNLVGFHKSKIMEAVEVPQRDERWIE